MTLPLPAAELQRRVRSRAAEVDLGYASPCWISSRATHPKGYTKMGILGSTVLTHRVAYEAFVGPIPDGMQIDHLCKRPACCNPQDLEPVTVPREPAAR